MRSDPGDGGAVLTVHQRLQRWAPEYLQQFGSALPERQRQVLQKILRCRTPALGGQLFQCPDCPAFAYRYHSCNDRHCPQSGQTDADVWLEKQKARLLLPVPYFLLTFTVPQELRPFIRSHRQIGLDLLFAASAQALRDLAGNPKRLGAQLGMLGVLHTWTRTLFFHPHVHLQWNYRESKTRRFTSIRLDPLEWVRRFLQHVLPRGFARVRTFGWLHPAAKVRANRVRALLRQAPRLTPEERHTWQPPVTTAPATVSAPASPKVEPSCAPHCPRCQSPMRLMGSWHPGQVVLYPKRPP